MFTFLCLGPGCLGDGGLPARASCWRCPQHSNAWKLCGFLPKTLQLFWWRPISGIQKYCNCPPGKRRHTQSPEVDAWDCRPLCDIQTFCLRWHICRCLEELMTQLWCDFPDLVMYLDKHTVAMDSFWLMALRTIRKTFKNKTLNEMKCILKFVFPLPPTEKKLYYQMVES